MNEKTKPTFRRTQGAMYTRLKGKGWRRPDGKHNKIREGKKGKGFVPRIGYGADNKTRFLHPSGMEDILVSNLNDLEGLDSQKQAVRIASGVGKRKKAIILGETKNRKLKVLNP